MNSLLPLLRTLQDADVAFVVVDDVEIPVAGTADLIAMKRKAGRAQDLADVEALEALAAVSDD